MMFYKFFPILLLFYSVFSLLSLLIPFPYRIPPFNPSPLSLIIFLTLASFLLFVLPFFYYFPSPLCYSSTFFSSSSSSSSTPSPLPAPPPTSSLITSYKFLPLSFIFSTPSPPPTTSYPSSYSSFPFYSFFFLLVLPFFFLIISPLSLFLTFLLVPLPPLLLFPPPFVISILVSLFDPSIFETGNDLYIYVRRNKKETWKIITNFEKYMYVLMFMFFTHVTLLDGLQFIKSRITFNLDRCTFELLDATNW